MPAGKLGQRPMRHSLKTMQKAVRTARALDRLGSAPPISPGYSAIVEEKTSSDWGMMGNDQVGDCVMADVGHRLMIWTAWGKNGGIVQPTTDEVLKLYSEVTGYDPSDPNSDQGAELPSTAEYIEQTGIEVGGTRYKSDGHGVIDPTNWEHIKWAVALFGCTPIAIDCPRSALEQFDVDEPWTYVPGSPILGGHDVLLVEYEEPAPDPHWQVITWGKRVNVSTDFLVHYLREVVPVVSHHFVQQNGVAPSGIDLNQMLADLS